MIKFTSKTYSSLIPILGNKVIAKGNPVDRKNPLENYPGLSIMKVKSEPEKSF